MNCFFFLTFRPNFDGLNKWHFFPSFRTTKWFIPFSFYDTWHGFFVKWKTKFNFFFLIFHVSSTMLEQLWNSTFGSILWATIKDHPSFAKLVWLRTGWHNLQKVKLLSFANIVVLWSIVWHMIDATLFTWRRSQKNKIKFRRTN